MKWPRYTPYATEIHTEYMRDTSRYMQDTFRTRQHQDTPRTRSPCETHPHDFRDKGTLQLWKTPSGSCLMASSAPGTLVSGAALDFALCVVDAAPHQAVDRSVPLSSASLCASARCLWAGPRTRRCMEASKLMLPASVLQGLPRASDGCCGFNLRCVLPAASPHARWRRSSARSVVSAASCWKRLAHDSGA